MRDLRVALAAALWRALSVEKERAMLDPKQQRQGGHNAGGKIGDAGPLACCCQKQQCYERSVQLCYERTSAAPSRAVLLAWGYSSPACGTRKGRVGPPQPTPGSATWTVPGDVVPRGLLFWHSTPSPPPSPVSIISFHLTNEAFVQRWLHASTNCATPEPNLRQRGARILPHQALLFSQHGH